MYVVASADHYKSRGTLHIAWFDQIRLNWLNLWTKVKLDILRPFRDIPEIPPQRYPRVFTLMQYEPWCTRAFDLEPRPVPALVGLERRYPNRTWQDSNEMLAELFLLQVRFEISWRWENLRRKVQTLVEDKFNSPEQTIIILMWIWTIYY